MELFMQIIFILSFVLLLWSYSGYLFFLYFISLSSAKNNKKSGFKNPRITIVVACFNEEKLIAQKANNILSLIAKNRLTEAVFVDGKSTDNTVCILKRLFEKRKDIKVVQAKERGKIPQINAVLPTLKGDIIVISDVDNIIHPNSFMLLVKEFSNASIGVVGSLVIPKNSMLLEKQYWRVQNRIRLLESQAHTSSITIGSCYAFRKKVLKRFPKDVIADDIYISFTANFAGLKTVYPNHTASYELRTPKTLKNWLSHKTRKGHAYIRELLRFLPMFGKGPILWQIMYITKCLQILVVPTLLAALPFFFFLAKTAVSYTYIISAGVIFLTALVLANRITITIYQKKNYQENLFLTIAAFTLTNVILFLQLWTYPFSKQTSSYKRID